MIRTLLKYRNLDATLDLNDQLSKLFSRGVVAGGEVQPVASTLAVDILPFKLIGFDGMVVIETSDTTRLNVLANQTNVVVFKSQYIPNDVPAFGFEVLSETDYGNRSDKDYLTVFARIPLGPSATQVLTSNILLQTRDEITPVRRLELRGVLANASLLPVPGNTASRAGDFYIVTDGLGDSPAIYAYNGAAFLNITDTLNLDSTLTAHRNNFFSNEIHLTDDQADAVTGTSGTPSASNKFITDADPRIPTQTENDALVGYSNSTPDAPDSTNPYVTTAFAQAEPVARTVPSGSPLSIILTPSEGPFYLGKGAGMADAFSYYKMYHASAQREFVNSAGTPTVIAGIFKDSGFSTPVIPIADTDAEGFYSAALYITLSGGAIDLLGRLIYGKRKNFQAVNRGADLVINPTSAQTSQETLVRLQDISGRLFDVSIPADEQNIELRKSVNMARNYLAATTADDIVVDSVNFSRLRDISELAADYPLITSETVLVAPAAYTVLSAPVASDMGLSSLDSAMTAVIQFSSAIPAGVKPGHIFVDSTGARYRILAKSGSPAVLTRIQVYTGGARAIIMAGSGSILAGNNPDQIELSLDHQTYLAQERFLLSGFEQVDSEQEQLPPGGSFLQPSGTTATLIGQNILPLQGNTGTNYGPGLGRPVYRLLPKKQGNRYDKRWKLIGNWTTDDTNYPGAAVGQPSDRACGLEYTGRISNLSLLARLMPLMPQTLRVFVDGAFNSDVSLTSFVSNLSSVVSDFRGAEATYYPINLGLALTDTDIHTVRIELIDEPQTTSPLVLYGMEVYYDQFVEEAGRAFTQSDLAINDSAVAIPFTTLQNVSTANSHGRKLTQYIDRTGARQVAVRALKDIVDHSGSWTSGPIDQLTLGSLVQGVTFVGDLIYIKPQSANQPSSIQRIASFPSSTIGQFTGANFSNYYTTGFALGLSDMMYWGAVPVNPSDGSILVSSVESLDTEYAKFAVSDWSIGVSARDIASLSADSPEDRCTILDDASTALLVRQCQRVTSGIEGATEAISLATASSTINVTAFCSRMDLVFVGNQGAVSATIKIDGMHSYTLPLKGQGVERHTVFYEAIPQSHTVEITAASSATNVRLAEIVLFEPSAASYNGTPVSEFTVLSNRLTASINGLMAARAETEQYLTGASNTISPAGLRTIALSKANIKLTDAPSITSGLAWRDVTDFTNSPRYGEILETTKDQAEASIEFIGSAFELQVLRSASAPNHLALTLDGVAISNSYQIVAGSEYAASFWDLSGGIDTRRLFVGKIPYGKHTLKLVNSNSPPGQAHLQLVGFACNEGYAAPQLENLDSTKPAKVRIGSAVKDLRPFVTLLPEQVGLVSGTDASSSTSDAITELQTARSGLVDIASEPYYFGVYCDWGMDADPIASPFSPVYSAAGWTPTSSFTGTAVRLGYDSLTVTGSGTSITLSALPAWAGGDATKVPGAILRVTAFGNANQNKAFRIISYTGSGNVFTIEDSVSGSLSTTAASISQCLYTKDLVQFKPGSSGDNQSIADRIPLPVAAELAPYVIKDVGSVLIDAEGSSATGTAGTDPIYGSTSIRLGFTASRQGLRTDTNSTIPTHAAQAFQSAWSAAQIFPLYVSEPLSTVTPPGSTDNELLFLRIFPMVDSGSGFVNVLRWGALLFEDTTSSVLSNTRPTAYGYTNNTVAATNCTITVVSSKTRITFPQPYLYNAFPNSTESALSVMLDGRKLAKNDGTYTFATGDGYFTEVSAFAIDLDIDYSTFTLPIEITFRQKNNVVIPLGKLTPYTWVLSGFLAVAGEAFDGPRTLFENRQFLQARVNMTNGGTAGTTTVQILKNGIVTATLSVPSTAGAAASVLFAVSVGTVPGDKLEANVTAAATGSKNLSVEVA